MALLLHMYGKFTYVVNKLAFKPYACVSQAYPMKPVAIRVIETTYTAYLVQVGTQLGRGMQLDAMLIIARAF